MRIGNLLLNNDLCLAPMAGITDAVFRALAKEFGCALTFSEMISADGLVRGLQKSRGFLKRLPDERPFAVQLFGSDPYILSESAGIAVENGAELINVNMGCPAKNVLKIGAGAALMKDMRKIRTIFKKMRDTVAVPLTVKLRAGWGKNGGDALEVAKLAEELGWDAVILHPRTVEQGFSGKADWRLIGTMKQRSKLPVIGNGDIVYPEDALAMKKETECDGVMIGRGAIGNPWIFEQVIYYRTWGKQSEKPTMAAREEVIGMHLEMNLRYFEEKIAIRNFRKCLPWYVRGLPGCSYLRKKASAAGDKEAMREVIREYFQHSRASQIRS
ncbi:MAG: tRNA dihydrouridine synthase DusB [Syntrophales bacterium]